MLITFECSVYPNITMFGDVANKLILYMGHSGTIPGAIDAQGVPAALEKIVVAVSDEMNSNREMKGVEIEDDNDNHIDIDKRAKTLIALLQAASKESAPVMWYERTGLI